MKRLKLSFAISLPIKNNWGIMQRFLVILLAAMFIWTGTASATDIHVETPCGEHVSIEKTGGGESLPDHIGPCGHCCHGASHYIALPLTEADLLVSLSHAILPLQNDSHLIRLPLAPPTPPPNR